MIGRRAFAAGMVLVLMTLLTCSAAVWADDAVGGTNRLTLDVTVAECEPQLLDKLPETTAQRMSPESLAQHNPAAPLVARCPSVFTGPADGYGGFLLRRLTEDRRASVQLKIDYAHLQGAIPATTNRLVWHTVNIAEHPDTVSCWIEEYGSPADEFLWSHHRRPSAVSAKWTCASGQVLFRLGEPERMERFGYFATFVVSNLQVAGQMTGVVERVSFDDVRVGWEGID